MQKKITNILITGSQLQQLDSVSNMFIYFDLNMFGNIFRIVAVWMHQNCPGFQKGWMGTIFLFVSKNLLVNDELRLTSG